MCIAHDERVFCVCVRGRDRGIVWFEGTKSKVDFRSRGVDAKRFKAQSAV